jgi:hypothetical protein
MKRKTKSKIPIRVDGIQKEDGCYVCSDGKNFVVYIYSWEFPHKPNIAEWFYWHDYYELDGGQLSHIMQVDEIENYQIYKDEI